MKKISVGILGLGTVGTSLVDIIEKSRDKIISKYGLEIIVKKILVRDLNKKRGVNLKGIQLTDNPKDIVFDNEINVVCECMGGSGSDLAFSYIIDAIKSGKHVVLSSKKMLSLFADLILTTSRESASIVKYDATVGGGVPTQRIINNCFLGEQINKIVGIVNATSNFIYYKMMVDNISFDAALLEAQKMGYAENDPSEDISGNDASYKLSILILMCMNKMIDVRQVQPIPITNTKIDDMIYAERLGYSIKPIIYAELCNDVVKYAVGPCLVKKESIISNVDLNNNLICFNGSLSGNLCFYGQGAGGNPTASAMFDDLIDVFFTKEERNSIPQYILVQKKEMKRYIRIKGCSTEINTIFHSCSYERIRLKKIIKSDSDKNQMEAVLFMDNMSDKEMEKYIEQLQDNKISIVSMFCVIDDSI